MRTRRRLAARGLCEVRRGGFGTHGPTDRAAPTAVSGQAARHVVWEEGSGCRGGGGGGGGCSSEMAETVADTRRLITKPQNLNDAYGPPSNFLEIDVSNPQTVGVGRGRFTTYEIRVKVRPSFPPTERETPVVPAVRRGPWSADPQTATAAQAGTPADTVGQTCPRAGSRPGPVFV